MQYQILTDRCRVNEINVLLRYTVHRPPEPCQQTQGETQVDIDCWLPRDVWWTVPRNYAVFFSFRVVKHSNWKQYLPVVLMSLNVSNSTFRKLAIFWVWPQHGHSIVTSRRWCFFLMTAINVNSSFDLANHSSLKRCSIVASLGCRKRISRATYWPCHGQQLTSQLSC